MSYQKSPSSIKKEPFLPKEPDVLSKSPCCISKALFSTQNALCSIKRDFFLGHDPWVATLSRLLKIICLFCRISSLLWGSFVQETYNFKEPTNRSHPIYDPCFYLHCNTTYVCMFTCRMHVRVNVHIARACVCICVRSCACACARVHVRA